MANRNDVRRARAGDKDLSGASFIRADLSEVDLSGADLTEADFIGADLSGADLSGADLYLATLAEADLSGAEFVEASIAEANLTKSDLTGADLSGANLRNADLTEANLTDATLVRANLAFATLVRADFTDANLTRADLSGANLTRANLAGTNLAGANLSFATLTFADLTGADLTGVNLTGVNLVAVNLANVKGMKPNVLARGSAYGRSSGAVLKLIADGPQPARDFKRKHPAEFERLKSLGMGGRDFGEKEIRSVVEKTRGARWVVTRKKYTSGDQRLCSKANDVLLFNVDLDARSLDRARVELRVLADISKRSGHPYEAGSLFTVGWVRYCDGGKAWLIEEVQSDVLAARFGLSDERTRAKLLAAGIDPDRFEDTFEVIRPYTERFYEDAIGVTFALAKQRGVAVEMLTFESKRTMVAPEGGKAAPRNVYAELPRSMGMSRRDRSEVLPDVPAWYYRPNPGRRVRRIAR